jgi:energy-converting hydrogenase Eha subunit E
MLASLLLVRAGFPPGLVGVVLWMAGGVFGLSLLQFAFLSGPIHRSAMTARQRPLRSFLVGLLVMEMPVLAASLFYLAGAKDMAVLLLVLVGAALTMLFWPAAISYQIGQRLAPDANGPGQVLAGSAVFSGTLLIPVFGWLWLFALGLLATGGRYA